jgi:hypothetical protein
LDEKYKTTLFFGVKLLKCPFEKKNQFKNTPKNDIVLKRKKKKEKEEEEQWGSLACSLGDCRLPNAFGGPKKFHHFSSHIFFNLPTIQN